jgi:hypothetical protein
MVLDKKEVDKEWALWKKELEKKHALTKAQKEKEQPVKPPCIRFLRLR